MYSKAYNKQLKRDWFTAALQTSPLAGRYTSVENGASE